MNKEDKIKKILAAARRPCPTIVASVELLATDGKSYGVCGFPLGVRAVKPYQDIHKGWVYQDKNGTKFGQRAQTEQELRDRHEAGQDANQAGFKRELENMPEEQLDSQYTYWVKE